MPEDAHFDAFPVSPTATVASLPYAIKRPFSCRGKQLLIEAGLSLCGDGREGKSSGAS